MYDKVYTLPVLCFAQTFQHINNNVDFFANSISRQQNKACLSITLITEHLSQFQKVNWNNVGNKTENTETFVDLAVQTAVN